ncbi:MAG: hypothetical protein PVSMB3_18860 [Candidatus Dormibacteraceae bacterium]
MLTSLLTAEVTALAALLTAEVTVAAACCTQLPHDKGFKLQPPCPVGSIKFTGSPLTYAYRLRVSGSTPTLMSDTGCDARYVSGVKNAAVQPPETSPVLVRVTSPLDQSATTLLVS